MVDCDRCHKKFTTYAALKQHYGNQHPNAKWPDTFENKLLDEKNLQTYKANLHPTRTSHTKLILAVVLIVVVVGASWAFLPSMFQSSTNPACAGFPFPPNGNQDLAEHYHALLYIYVNGQQVNLPANIGDGDTGPCQQPLHVHANEPSTSMIHIESPITRDYTLGEFFKVWAATPDIGGPTPVVFNQNQIFSNAVGNGYELRIYVNGQQSTAYDSLVLQNHMTIVVVYGNAATNWGYYQNLSAQPWSYPNY
jgi:hypothetical protein